MEQQEKNKEGEFTYIGARGNTVINYNIVNEMCNYRIRNFKISNRIESDHMPLILTLDQEEEEEEEGMGKMEKRRWKTITRWYEEARAIYKERTERNGEKTEEGEENIEDKWRNLKKLIEKGLVKGRIKRKSRGLGYRV